MKTKRSLKVKTYTIVECNAELEIIRRKYKEVKKSFREEIRTTLQFTQIVLGRLRRNKKLQMAYQQSVLKKRKNRRGVAPEAFDLSLEVVCKATGAVGRNPRQLASKRARVLDYLRELKVADDETAAYIKKNGGIEKLYNESIQKKKEAADQSDTDPKTGDKKKRKVEPTSSSSTNDQTIEVKVMMSLSDRDKIAESKIGTGATLHGKIDRRSKIKISSVTLDTEEEEWD